MPLSLNALLNIPTRDEKFTRERDSYLDQLARARAIELDRIGRERDVFNLDTADQRMAADLSKGLNLPADVAATQAAEARSSGLLANLEKARTLQGSIPSAIQRGAEAVGLASKKTANEMALENQRSKAISAAEPYVSEAAVDEEETKKSERRARKSTADKQDIVSSIDAQNYPAVAPGRIEAELAGYTEDRAREADNALLRPILRRGAEAATEDAVAKVTGLKDYLSESPSFYGQLNAASLLQAQNAAKQKSMLIQLLEANPELMNRLLRAPGRTEGLSDIFGGSSPMGGGRLSDPVQPRRSLREILDNAVIE